MTDGMNFFGEERNHGTLGIHGKEGEEESEADMGEDGFFLDGSGFCWMMREWEN